MSYNLHLAHLSSYGTGVVALRDTAKYTGQLIFESVFGILVALSNITTMTVFVVGWKTLFKVTSALYPI